MARLVWDGIGEKKFEAGTSNGVLYPLKDDGTYDDGVAWNGLTAVTESPSGAEPTDLYADNIKYATMRSAETLGGTIEAYTYPKEFAKCDGSAEVTPGVYIGQQGRQGFGFSYKTAIGSDVITDLTKAYKIHIFYGCTVSPSDKSYATINDSPDAVTLSWEFTTSTVNVTGKSPSASIVIDSTVADPAKLKSLEDILYGTADDEPRLPLPDEIVQLFTTV